MFSEFSLKHIFLMSLLWIRKINSLGELVLMTKCNISINVTSFYNLGIKTNILEDIVSERVKLEEGEEFIVRYLKT